MHFWKIIIKVSIIGRFSKGGFIRGGLPKGRFIFVNFSFIILFLLEHTFLKKNLREHTLNEFFCVCEEHPFCSFLYLPALTTSEFYNHNPYFVICTLSPKEEPSAALSSTYSRTHYFLKELSFVEAPKG